MTKDKLDNLVAVESAASAHGRFVASSLIGGAFSPLPGTGRTSQLRPLASVPFRGRHAVGGRREAREDTKAGRRIRRNATLRAETGLDCLLLSIGTLPGCIKILGTATCNCRKRFRTFGTQTCNCRKRFRTLGSSTCNCRKRFGAFGSPTCNCRKRFRTLGSPTCNCQERFGIFGTASPSLPSRLGTFQSVPSMPPTPLLNP